VRVIENSSARTTYFFSDTETGFLRRYLHAVAELDSRPRVVREEELPSRSTWSHRLATCAAAAIPSPRFHHAAEHHAEAERARGHASCAPLANAAGLRELMLIPCAIAAQAETSASRWQSSST